MTWSTHKHRLWHLPHDSLQVNTDYDIVIYYFLRINVTEKYICHTGNQTHDPGTNRLAHIGRMLYNYTNSISKNAKFIGAYMA